MSLLRQYEPFECGEDGYPYAWHHESVAEDQSNRHPGDGPLLEPPIKDLIREQAQHRCERCWHPYRKGMGEWSPCDEACKHGGPVRRDYDDYPGTGGSRSWVEAQWRILTVHHLDGQKANCRWWNLVALCQRDHLYIQRVVKMDHVFPYEHSTWFKPYAAGYYAWKYLAEDLTREETMARQDELLALEHRFTQGTLL